MGNSYNITDQCEKAIDCYGKALEIAEELGDGGEMRKTYRNMGISCNITDQYEKAIDCDRKDLEIPEKLGEKGEAGRTYSNMGAVYNKIGHNKKAENHRKTSNIDKQLGDKQEME